MRTARLGTVLAVVAVAASILVVPAQAQKKAPAGPTVVGTDDADDWGCNHDCSLAPIGDELGQELVEAAFEMADKKTVNFIIKVNSLPAPGGVPEATRYTWDFGVDNEIFQMSGGFTEYVRGICNPNMTNTCPPPRDPGESPFFLRQGSCLVGEECIEVGLVHASFDASSGTITIPVPLEILKAKPGSKITPGSGNFGGTIYSVSGIFVTNATLPHDVLTVTDTYVIPKGKKRK